MDNPDLILEIDGASQGNPGPAGAGIVIRDASGRIVDEIGQFLGVLTNNQAEYQALLRGLREVAKLGARRVQIKSDSELLVRQMTGIYKVKDQKLLPLVQQARVLMRDRLVGFTHVDRSLNWQADALATRAVNQARQAKAGAAPAASAPQKQPTPAPAAPQQDQAPRKKAPASRKAAAGKHPAPGKSSVPAPEPSLALHSLANTADTQEETQVSAGGVVTRKEGGQVRICLIAKKGKTIWALPKGRVDPGETPEQTAVREVYEETGLVAEVKGLVDQIDYHFFWRETETLYHKVVYFYLMNPVGGELKPRDPEAELARWFPLGEASRKLTYLNEKEVVRKAQKLLEAR